MVLTMVVCVLMLSEAMVVLYAFLVCFFVGVGGGICEFVMSDDIRYDLI
jgi:hypothetical protein